MTFSSVLKLALRRRALERTFRNQYTDLLKAISQDNYEALEHLCEETLLEELAAKVFEYEKYRGIQFRVSGDADKELEIEVINHFYVQNASVSRKSNPSLKEFKMVQKSKNVIEFQPKSNEHDFNS